MWNPSTSDCECNKACTIDKYLDSKNCSCEERQIGKLVLECKDEMLKTPETLLDDKKKTRKKNCLIHTISLAIIFLSLQVLFLLAAITITQKIGLKKNTYYRINNLKEINFKNCKYYYFDDISNILILISFYQMKNHREIFSFLTFRIRL